MRNRLLVIMEKGRKRIITQTPLKGIGKITVVVNHQFTNAPNTTQIASGAGRSSAAGNNAAIDSPDTRQQQSVGAGGEAINKGICGPSSSRGHSKKKQRRKKRRGKEITIVLNHQKVKLPPNSPEAAATQVASGSGLSSTAGTNSAIDSPRTRQQHAVGGGGVARNKAHGKKFKHAHIRRKHRKHRHMSHRAFDHLVI
ncbi:hypothetical protein DCC85_21315 [Paenibacillus sp. CAA11]|nr:hypothetical protein DCC85_21315 [Paenibacillus sp. CAA11]